MGLLTSANGSVQPVDDVATGDANAAGLVVDDGMTVQVSGSSDQPVVFAAATGTLNLENSSSFSGQISGFGGGEHIDLADIFSGASTTLAYSAQGNDLGTTLTVSDGADTTNLLFGQYMASDFAFSSDDHGGQPMTDPLPRALTAANAFGPDSNGADAAAAQAGGLNINSSSASPVMLSAGAEQAPPEITAGLVWAYCMSDDAFGVVAASTQGSAPPSGGNAFGSVTTTMPDVGPSSDGEGFVVTDAGLSNGNPVANVTTQNSGLVTVGAAGGATPDPATPLQNTWQQNLALMGNYMASTFPPQASTDSGRPDSAALLTTPAQGTLAAQVLSDHQNST